MYVGIDSFGSYSIIPVQAKSGKDQISVVQTKQDLKWCEQKFPGTACRAISAQFIKSNLIALFELVVEDGQVKVVEEKHYQLVPASEIDIADTKRYK